MIRINGIVYDSCRYYYEFHGEPKSHIVDIFTGSKVNLTDEINRLKNESLVAWVLRVETNKQLIMGSLNEDYRMYMNECFDYLGINYEF